jgi:hypothetical protein
MPTICEQAVIDLAAYKKALVDLLTGSRVVEVAHGDKRTSLYAAGNVEALERLIRLKQVEVDNCNGVRSRGRFIHNMPIDT